MIAPRVGLDLVDVAAFRSRFEQQETLLNTAFTERELAYCRTRRDPWPHLAARFAAKESAVKALGSGLAGAMEWKDIEVVRDPAGAPGLAFHGAVADRVRGLGLGSASVSLSHTGCHAMAVVLLLPN